MKTKQLIKATLTKSEMSDMKRLTVNQLKGIAGTLILVLSLLGIGVAIATLIHINKTKEVEVKVEEKYIPKAFRGSDIDIFTGNQQYGDKEE